MARVLQLLFFLLLVKPLVFLLLGVNLRRPELLPQTGPAIIVANHNSHLDTMVLMALYPLKMIRRLRPVAAMDYFMRNPLLAWFATRIIGIIPLQRTVRAGSGDPLAESVAALERGEILILFPEGSRGEPEKMGAFRAGIAHLAKRAPEVPVVPVFLHGLGMALPKGEALLVPFFCDVFVGQGLCWKGDRVAFMAALADAMQRLVEEGHFPEWE
jgi:1-acyl-sn-glycerol-3-phosphate acyltransferase